MTSVEFRKQGHVLIAWITDYWERIESLPVLPAIGDLCREQGIWFHIDGAMSGTAVAIQQQQVRLTFASFPESVGLFVVFKANYEDLHQSESIHHAWLKVRIQKQVSINVK